MNPDPVVWFNNKFVPLSEANVNILTHALNYGTGVFEGIRGYFERGELYLVRPLDHYARWKRNAGIIRIDIPPSARELAGITSELCRRNNFRSHVYARPLAYKSAARIGVAPDAADAHAIVVVPFGDYFDSKKGLRAGVSSWRRIEDNAIPGRAKICGAYVNSVLATDEARRNGHDEAIFLTESGHVAEGATCNLFLVRDGRLITPPAPTTFLKASPAPASWNWPARSCDIGSRRTLHRPQRTLPGRRTLLHRHRRRGRADRRSRSPPRRHRRHRPRLDRTPHDLHRSHPWPHGRVSALALARLSASQHSTCGGLFLGSLNRR